MGITLKNNKSVTKNMTIKGDNGVGIKTITSGTPVITEEKTTTPITVTLTDETTQNFNVEAKNGSGAGNALTKPTTAPSATQLVAVDNTNTQTMLNIGDGLSVENGSLKASGGGTGEKKYFHQIALFDAYNNLGYYFNLVTTTPKFEYGDTAFNEIPVNTYITCFSTSLDEEGAVLTSLPIVARKDTDAILLLSFDFATKKMTSYRYSQTLDLVSDHSVEI